MDPKTTLEALQDITKQTNERINSPILMSFALSWLAWNWKLIFITFANDLDYQGKIDQIIINLSNHPKWFGYLPSNFCGPLLFMIFYVFILQIFNEEIYTRFIIWIKERNLKKQIIHNVKMSSYEAFDTFKYIELSNELINQISLYQTFMTSIPIGLHGDLNKFTEKLQKTSYSDHQIEAVKTQLIETVKYLNLNKNIALNNIGLTRKILKQISKIQENKSIDRIKFQEAISNRLSRMKEKLDDIEVKAER